MIVRIMGEGQVKLADSHFAELNKLDDELLAEMESGDESGFRRTLTALLDRSGSWVTPPGRRAGTLGADPPGARTRPSTRSGRC